MITTIYHVSVSGSHELREMLSIDNEISEAFGQEIYRIRGNAVDSGCNMYDDHEEWAEFHNLPEAREFERQLASIIAKYEAKTEAWKKAYYAD